MAQRYDDNLLEIMNARGQGGTAGVGQYDPTKQPFSVPGLQPPGDMRTHDFQDANGNGKDDRDEPQAPQFKFGQQSVMDILGKYAHTPQGLQQAFDENPDLAGVSSIGGSKGDKILDPNTGRLIDVIQAAGEGGKAWQWLDEPGGQQSRGPIGASQLIGSLGQGMPTDQGFFEQLMQMARQQAGLDRGGDDRQHLLSLLGGGQ